MTPQIRLLACSVCKTIEELPDFDGPPEQDHLLKRLIEKHGPEENRHVGQMFRVEQDQWQSESVKYEIAKRITAKLGGGETGLGSAYYDLKNTFAADAMSCFQAHQRNPACGDYKSDSKRLTPGTAAARREAGLPEYRTEHDHYLCEHCPVHSLVEQAARAKAGLYK
jgi:hypothetical protein